jgi:DNA integrity scanning protein DisA with diadenylate cyclase activity
MLSEALARLTHFFARDLHAILWDVADIALVATIIYFVLLLLKGTRAMQMGVGIVLVFVVYQSAKRLGLVTLYTMLDTLLTSIVLFIGWRRARPSGDRRRGQSGDVARA